MTSLRLLPLALAAASATPLAAQNVNATVGPTPAPLGCPISITLSNDAPFLGSTTPCPYKIYDAQQQLVYDPGCPDAALLMGPYGWSTSSWDQRDQGGTQVAPGMYWVEVSYDFGPNTYHAIVLGGDDANLVFEGTATTGQTFSGQPRNFYLCSPQDAGFAYFLLGSFTADAGAPNCAGTFPLDADFLLTLTLTPNSVFKQSLGFLNANGRSKAPTFQAPDDPTLIGVSFHTAFVVLDPASPTCTIRRNSLAYRMEII